MGKATRTGKEVTEGLRGLGQYGKLLKNASKGLPERDWEPLRTHWTVSGELCRKEEREAYSAIPSQYNGGLNEDLR